MKGQDELTRRRRLVKGRCPTHGISLKQIGIAHDGRAPIGPFLVCPRRDCDFCVAAKPGSMLYAFCSD